MTIEWQSVRQRRNWAAIVADYYAAPHVRARIREFLGGGPGHVPCAVYVSANDDSQDYRTEALDLQEVGRCLDEGMEIYRSLWDRVHLLVNLDMEYVNSDLPGYADHEFDEAFAFQRPLAKGIQARLKASGITPQHVLSGQGHHFTWSVRRDSPASLELAQVGRVSSSLLAKYHQRLPPRAESIGLPLARAFAGLGLVLEYLTHEVLRSAARRSSVPETLSTNSRGTCG